MHFCEERIMYIYICFIQSDGLCVMVAVLVHFKGKSLQIYLGLNILFYYWLSM